MNYADIAQSLSDLKSDETMALTNQAISEELPPDKIILLGLCKGMEMVGERYERKEYFVPDMLKASTIFKTNLDKLEPLIVGQKAKSFAKGAIGVVKGNTQDNGKNIVRIMLRANGVDITDLGKSVPLEKFVEAAREGADFIAISIMTSAGVNQAKKVVRALEDEGLRNKVKIFVGGAAVDAQKATEIVGADAYADNATESVNVVKEWFAK